MYDILLQRVKSAGLDSSKLKDRQTRRQEISAKKQRSMVLGESIEGIISNILFVPHS